MGRRGKRLLSSISRAHDDGAGLSRLRIYRVPDVPQAERVHQVHG
jgi:hypothetical protein